MNNAILYAALAFVGGAAVGGFVGYKFAEKKFSALADEEIKSVKEHFTVPIEVKKKTEKKPGAENPEDASKKALNKPGLVEYTKRLKEATYVNYSDKEEENKPAKYPWESSDKFSKDGPYIVSPTEYGDEDDYDETDLILYADGILADKDDNIIDNVDEVLGKGTLEHMGEYEEDALHVCNPVKKIYYEILADERSYEKATKKKPNLSDDEEVE